MHFEGGSKAGKASTLIATLRSDGLSDALLRTQIASATRSYPITFAMSLAVAAGVLWAAIDAPNRTTIIGTALLHAIISCIMLLRWFRDRAAGWQVDRPLQRVRQISVEAAFVALGWYIFLSNAGLHAEPQLQVLVVAVMAGVMAVGSARYASIPAAASSFLATVGIVCAIYARVSSIEWPVYAFLAVFILMLGRNAIAQHRLIVSQFQSGSETERARGEIALLAAREAETIANRQAEEARSTALVQARQDDERRRAQADDSD